MVELFLARVQDAVPVEQTLWVVFEAVLWQLVAGG